MRTREKTTLYLRSETVQALSDYLHRHAPHLRSKSDVVELLLCRALQDTADARGERAAVEGVRDEIVSYLAQQSDRLAALLLQSGKDAHRAAQMVELLSARILDDTHAAARLAEEARLRAGARYTRRDLPPPDSRQAWETNAADTAAP